MQTFRFPIHKSLIINRRFIAQIFNFVPKYLAELRVADQAVFVIVKDFLMEIIKQFITIGNRFYYVKAMLFVYVIVHLIEGVCKSSVSIINGFGLNSTSILPIT